ncbi:serine/threonine protein kinase [Ruania sp. N2-46]|uniref:non-specific serine/threonine protein kinase n=2 Tax=Occultella gossypii TaxID=2800820 RepID=A0ABS7SB69_9MICO|nr:serine/threonine protein kinase [Occultella gossypii]
MRPIDIAPGSSPPLPLAGSARHEGVLGSAERVLGGRYAMGAVIGRGGMATVHLGRDLRLGRRVAIKMLRADLAGDPVLQSRFRREAQAVAALDHPAIVTVFDTGCEPADGAPSEEGPVPFIVMEYVAGQSLRDLIRDGALTLTTSIRHQVAILSALEVSHRAGIVHRDVKPANVMITPDGDVKVVDFGIARSTGDSSSTITQTWAILGTAHYLSPEQVRGEVADARSDLYSAGCLLYELLTGRPPFVGADPVSVAYQHVHQQPAPISNLDLPPALDAVLHKALAKNPDGRFQSARDFKQELLSAATGLAGDGAEVDASDNPVPWHRSWATRTPTTAVLGNRVLR